MSPTDVNRSGEMEVFVQVVDRGGFSAAARHLELTPSAVSKLIGRLEARLGARLVHRSTRKLQLTPEGSEFYERCARVLADIDEAERSASGGGAPRGRVRVNASLPFGHHVLLPLVPRFAEQYPELALDITLTDQVVDLMEERTDIAIRWGRLPASGLVARLLGETRQAIVAAPAYLRRHGTPRTPGDLLVHKRLGWSYRRSRPDWPMLVDGRCVEIKVAGSVRAGDGETLRRLAIEGVGLARLSLFHVQADLDAGRLVPVLEAFNPGEREPVHAVYLGGPGRLPARVRVVLDFLVDHVVL
ncbi:LysR family transcriptional regulator [Aquabacterium sp. A7-Y]|uniref:LysR family transcriptional regulator n=1 Tax=Aquabacterium sp. A7-Y TaxID=1349605 RepID=UPI00223E8EA5|nr:LysR family transcriptional regulator [Aquabacterium sp. A7-Y]MCW7541649.1 LysR family transcriptional regulator [Aquabacterium sp. A7-Y]